MFLAHTMMYEALTDDVSININIQEQPCAWARVADIVLMKQRQRALLASKTSEHVLMQCRAKTEAAEDVALCGTVPDKVVHLSLYRLACPPAAVAQRPQNNPPRDSVKVPCPPWRSE